MFTLDVYLPITSTREKKVTELWESFSLPSWTCAADRCNLLKKGSASTTTTQMLPKKQKSELLLSPPSLFPKGCGMQNMVSQ